MNDIRLVFSEISNNLRRIYLLARFEIRAQNKETFLGTAWNFLNPVLQIFVYWFVFSVGLRMTTVDGGYSYVTWLTCGILPWMVLNNAMLNSAGSFFSNASILKNMRIPLAVIPLKAVMISMINHLFTMTALVAFIWVSGTLPDIRNIQVVYYMSACMIFLIAFGLAASAVTAVFRDFQSFLRPILRLLFYVSSVVWPIEKLPGKLQIVLKLNPLTYIIEGYRDCLMYHNGFILNMRRGLLFWAETMVLMWIGCHLHVRFRKNFIDVL